MKFNKHLFADKSDLKGNKRIPALFIPTLYFAEGLPYMVVNVVSVLMYTRLGIPESKMALYTSILMWPWILKMFWGPLVDRYSTIRTWLLSMQLLCALFFAFVGLSLNLDLNIDNIFYISLILLGIIAFISATNDISIDGFYMLSLNSKQQAFFIGIRSLFYRIAMLFSVGILYNFVGYFNNSYSVQFSWASGMFLCSFIFIIVSIFHIFYLPYPHEDISGSKKVVSNNFAYVKYSEFLRHYLSVFKHFFSQNKIVPILLFIFLYRFGEAMVVKINQPFFIRSVEEGGLGLSDSTVGSIYGIGGLISLITGGILGGWLIVKFGLKKCIWPMAFAMNIPNLLYVYLAYVRPDLPVITAAVAIEQFGYGIGFSAFMMFLIQISKGENKTSLYAIATGIMAFGLMVPGSVSGYISEWLGYRDFFIFATLLTIPGMLTIFFIPLENEEEKTE
ncbi:MFS transporter [candidate division KSB1 bacterium]